MAKRKPLTPIQKSAKGQRCTVRVPLVCNDNPETTVLAHMNGGGMGRKHSDLFGAHSCSSCHAFIDGGWCEGQWQGKFTKEQVRVWHDDGIFETQDRLIEQGLIQVAA